MSVLGPRLRHRITFEQQVEVRDSDGVLAVTWDDVFLDSDTPLVDVPAEVLTGPGREFRESGQVQAELAARITVRWFPGLEASWRIRHGDDVYNIGTWDTDRTGRREYRIRCTTGVNDGQ